MSADEQVLRAAFGPLFAQTLGQFFAQPALVIDLRAERVRKAREASERRHEQRHAEPPEAA